MNELRLDIYDEFRCTADKCPLTCCQGWAIRADGGIYDKWNANEDTKYLCEKTTYKHEGGQDIYHMACDENKTCLMLDCNGLCEIVKQHGDEYLSDTCQSFPRKKNNVTDFLENIEEKNEITSALKTNEDDSTAILLREYSLSGACPAVIDIINNKINLNKKYQIITFEGEYDFPMEYRIRNQVIRIIQREDFKLTDKLMLAFSFLQECLECEWEEDVDNCIEVYQDKENLLELIELFEGEVNSNEEIFQEICQTYYDVTEFYKEEPMYKPYFYKNADFIEELFPSVDDEESKTLRKETLEDWQEFKEDFTKYDKLFEQIILSEIFADCVSDDLGYVIEAYQAAVLEYIMTRLSVFLSQKEQYESIKTYICLFIRAIGHNTEGMAEYWEENFEDSILDKEYFCMILQ